MAIFAATDVFAIADQCGAFERWEIARKGYDKRTSERMRISGSPSSIVIKQFGDRVDEYSGSDVRPDFTRNVDLRIAVRWKEQDFELIVRWPDERACIGELLVSFDN